MRLLVDECVPRKLKNSFAGHDCRTVPEEGLSGKKNGELLALAEKAGFQVFLTMDRGLEYQQNLRRHDIAVILLRARSSRLPDLLPLVSDIIAAPDSAAAGQVVTISRGTP
jgi:predicted nuclease of predicted toxin-antitoxin system